MNNIFLFLFTVVISLAGHAQAPLSEEAEISVITCGPWQGELYSAFGHSAFRVYDPVNHIDEAYNYGVFDFDQPNFYLNFAKGFLYYKLGVYDYPAFRNYYVYHNRYVHEQRLNLTQEQRQKVYNFLQWNAKPENVNYRYDYFYNNCATKIRDVMVQVFSDSIRFDGSYIDKTASFRELTDRYLYYQPWGDLGIDICLGLPMDKVASPNEHMFLPDYVEWGFDHAFIRQAGGEVPLVEEKIIIYESRPEELPSRLPHPFYVFSFIAAATVALSLYDLRRQRPSTWFDMLLFGVVGLIGSLLLLLWTATDHQAAAKNLNILWALPTHVVAAGALPTRASWIKKYFLIAAVFAVVVLISWPFLPQSLNTSLVPVVIMLAARSFVQFRLRKT